MPSKVRDYPTRRSLKPSDVLLVGRLYLVRGAGEAPRLGLRVWCPYCKRHHDHGLLESLPKSAAVEHHHAHCNRGSPLLGQGYYIGLDSEMRKINREELAKFSRELAAWQAMQGHSTEEMNT